MPVKELVLVYFGINAWDSIKQRPQHLAERLSVRNKIVYVNPPLDPIQIHLVPSNHRTRTAKQLRRLSICEARPNLWVVNPPPFIPGSSVVGFLWDVQFRMLTKEITETCTRKGIEPNVIWLSHPSQAASLMTVRSDLIRCYDCMDDYVEMIRKVARLRSTVKFMEAKHNEILEKADIVFASSSKIELNCRSYAKQIIRVPNGVDFQHFQDVAHCESRRNGTTVKPIVGFWGHISYWVDFELIAKISEQRPDWTIRMIGECNDTGILERLKERPNIDLVGPVDYKQLPEHACEFDVCILPFVTKGLGESVNPVKMYEYLATGRPIVSTNIPEVRPYSPPIRIARDAYEFVSSIEDALKNPLEFRVSQLRIAECNDWKMRSAVIESSIRETFGDRL